MRLWNLNKTGTTLQTKDDPDYRLPNYELRIKIFCRITFIFYIIYSTHESCIVYRVPLFSLYNIKYIY